MSKLTGFDFKKGLPMFVELTEKVGRTARISPPRWRAGSNSSPVTRHFFFTLNINPAFPRMSMASAK